MSVVLEEIGCNLGFVNLEANDQITKSHRIRETPHFWNAELSSFWFFQGVLLSWFSCWFPDFWFPGFPGFLVSFSRFPGFLVLLKRSWDNTPSLHLQSSTQLNVSWSYIFASYVSCSDIFTSYILRVWVVSFASAGFFCSIMWCLGLDLCLLCLAMCSASIMCDFLARPCCVHGGFCRIVFHLDSGTLMNMCYYAAAGHVSKRVPKHNTIVWS